MQRSQEDGFSGLTDPWAHGQRPSYAFPVTTETETQSSTSLVLGSLS
jgi:hypothetical protein